MNETKSDKILNDVLLPFEITEDYSESLNINNILKNRAVSLRRALEGIIEIFYKEKIKKTYGLNQKKYNKLKLSEKINYIAQYTNHDELITAFDNIRRIGNNGAHYSGNIDDSKLKDAICKFKDIVINIFVIYFTKHPFGSEPHVLTILSLLPPVNRVHILEKLSTTTTEINLDIVDKLSMAYVKNGQKEKAIEYINNLHQEDKIDDGYHEAFNSKLNVLEQHVDKFDISSNLTDSQVRYEEIFNSGTGMPYNDFVNMFSALLSGYRKST